MKANRRYYLHRRARKDGYRLDARSGIVFTPPGKTGEESKYVTMLVNELRYKRQTTLF